MRALRLICGLRAIQICEIDLLQYLPSFRVNYAVIAPPLPSRFSALSEKACEAMC